MNKKIFAVSDTNSEYVERFCRCLTVWEERRFDVRGFTEREALAEALAAEKADLLLIGEAMLGNDPEFRRSLTQGCRRMLLLSEQRSGGGEIPSIYRYQPLDRMLRQIASYCEEQEDEELAAVNGQAAVYGIYSPVRRCYKTTFSLILGQILAERGATLYINLEDVTGLSALEGSPGEETLSDLLYSYRIQPSGRPKILSAVQNMGKLAYLPPVVCPGDIRETDPEEIAEVLSAVSRSDTYESMVIDLGDALQSPLPILRLCRKIYMPVREDAVSQAKLEAWERMLPEQKEEMLQERIQKIRLPSYSRMEAAQPEIRELRRSTFGRYVERVLSEAEAWK